MSLLSAAPVRAQDQSREIAELRASVRELRAEIDALKRLVAAAQPPAPAAPAEPDPAIAMLQSQVAEQAQVKVESKSKMPVILSGTIVSNTYVNSGEANWLENPNIVAAESGPTGSFGSTLKQTQLSASINGPEVGGWRATGFVAVDFLGGAPGFQTGSVMGLPRLLYAFGRLEREKTAIEIGQDDMILAPRDPTTLAAPGIPDAVPIGQPLPAHATDSRRAAARRRHEPARRRRHAARRRLSESVHLRSRGRRRRAIARAAAPRRDSASGAAPMTRRTWTSGCRATSASERRTTGTRDEWASALDWNLQAGRVGFGGEAYAGEALAALGGAMGQVARSRGGFAEVRFKASQRVSFNGGGGLDRVDAGDRALVALRQNRTWFGNAIITLTPELGTSLEYRNLQTETSAGVTRENHHVNLAFAFSF